MHNLLRKIIWKLDYTGERVIISEMKKDTRTLSRHLSRYVFAINYSSNKNILDIACGTGYGTALLSSVAKKITGIDINKDSIIYAKKNNIFYSPIKFITADIERIKINDKYDIIISFETIEHLKDPNAFLTDIKNNLMNKGKFIFSIPLNDPPNKYHKHRFNWKSLILLVKSTNLKNIKWYSQIETNITKGEVNNAQFAIGIWNKL